MPSVAPELSVVIPVYNEEEVLPALFARLYPALDALARDYEIVFVNDGSRDRSAALLGAQFELRPDVTRVAVSYTHLDVYKRQWRCCACIACYRRWRRGYLSAGSACRS